MSTFFTDSLFFSLRRFPHLLIIAVLGWLPATAALWFLLERGLRIPNASDFVYDFYLSPQSAVLALVVDPKLAALWAGGFIAAYLLGQVVVSGAFSDQLFRLSVGSPRPWYKSLGRSISRVHRTLPAVLALLSVFALALAVPVAVVGYLVFSGERYWVFLAAVGMFLLIPSVALAVWLYGRLALMPTAAVLSPRRTWTLRLSLRATSGRWWAVMVRFFLVALIVGSVTSILATPLAILGLSGSALLVSAALIGRMVLSLASASFSTASLALIYVDTGAPTYLGISSPGSSHHEE